MLTNHDGSIYIRPGSKLEPIVARIIAERTVFTPDPNHKVNHLFTIPVIHPNSIAARLARRAARATA